MERISTPTAVEDAAGPGRRGFVDGNLAIGQPPTAFNAAWCNTVQEELAGPVEAAGLTLDPAYRLQLLEAIRRIAPANLLNVRVYAAAGTFTYVPTARTAFVVVEACGGGGGGGGSPGTGSTPTQDTPAGGGAAGTTGVGKFTAAQIGASQVVTVGAGGAGGAAGVNSGAAGGTSSFGALLSCPGGLGGQSLNPVADFVIVSGGAPGAAATGANLWSSKGEPGAYGIGMNITAGIYATSGPGGSSSRGAGAPGAGANNAGVAGTMGSGGSGAHSYVSAPGYAGGKGGDGFVIISEYGVAV